MKIAVGSDHGGFKLVNEIKELLRSKDNIEVLDFAPENKGSVDYPDFAVKVAKAVQAGEADRGILICGTGIGMSITANKFKGIRAALVYNEFTTKMCREHNDANILCLGGRTTETDLALKLVDIFLTAKFEGGRHIPRLDKISNLE